jgi:hypothetical protein
LQLAILTLGRGQPKIRQHLPSVIKRLEMRIILADIFLEAATDQFQFAIIRRQSKHRELDAG